MITAQFGIIENINPDKDYSSYEPEKYGCVPINDELYIDDWWEQLMLMKTFFHNLSRPELGLARWGVTLIPPESLPVFQDIAISDKRMDEDENLVALANLIKEAIEKQKYIIHFGV